MVNQNATSSKQQSRVFRDIKQRETNSKVLACLSRRKDTNFNVTSDKNILKRSKQGRDENIFKYSTLLLKKSMKDRLSCSAQVSSDKLKLKEQEQ